MNVTLQQRAVRMARFVGTATQQAVTEATLELPAALPDMARVVRVAANPLITGWEAMDNEVAIQGTVDFVVLYAHEREVPVAAQEFEAERGYEVDGEDAPSAYETVQYQEVLYRHRWRRAGSFELILDVPGAHPDVDVDLCTLSEDMDVQLHQTGRGLDVEAVVSVTARVKEHEDASVYVQGDAFPADADADVQDVQVEHAAGRGQTHLSVEGTLSVTTDVPLARVIDVAAWARADAEAAADHQVVVSGSVDYRALCVDENGDLVTIEWHEQTPLSYTFDMQGVKAGATVRADARVTGVDAVVSVGGREVELYTDVEVSAAAGEVLRLPLVVGLAGPEGTDIRYRTAAFNLEEWMGDGTADERLRQTLELPPGHPPIDKILLGEAHAVVDDVLVVGDKIIAEGYVDVSCLYVARTEGQPVHYVAWRKAVPIESEVMVEGAEPGMDAEVHADVASVELDLLNREALEADVRVSVDATLSRPVEREAIVEAVAVLPAEEDPPTLTFVVVQPGDTLWKLSHRYHTDVESIVRANPWLEGAEEASLPIGRKLCVPRKRPTPSVSA